MATVTFYVEKTNTGFSAYCEALGIAATGKNLKALQRDAIEGLEAQCEMTGENPEDFKFEYTYDFGALFEVFRLNVDAVSEFLGMNPTLISQYINHKKVPSQKQKERIESGIHSYAKALADFHFA